MIKVSINNQVYHPATMIDLEQLINDSKHLDFMEIWIDGIGDSSLCLMTNRERSFLMYLRYSGDCGFSSRSSETNSDKYCDFKLSNGQIDSYPENWTVDKELGFESLKEYFRTGERDTRISWKYDG